MTNEDLERTADTFIGKILERPGQIFGKRAFGSEDAARESAKCIAAFRQAPMQELRQKAQ